MRGTLDGECIAFDTATLPSETDESPGCVALATAADEGFFDGIVEISVADLLDGGGLRVSGSDRNAKTLRDVLKGSGASTDVGFFHLALHNLEFATVKHDAVRAAPQVLGLAPMGAVPTLVSEMGALRWLDRKFGFVSFVFKA